MFRLTLTLAALIFIQQSVAWKLGRLERYNSRNAQSNASRRPLTLPGTKWCGPGNASSHYNDLGKFANTDECCRDHDHCFDIIEAGQSKYGLSNPAPYTRLHCECEKQFYKCLKDSDHEDMSVSPLVGVIYFDALSTMCFKNEYPIMGCKSYYKYGRCAEYDVDRTGKKIWQWFDVPMYGLI